MTKLFRHLLFLLALGLVAGACSEELTDPYPEPEHEHAEVMFFHAANGRPSVDVQIDGSTAISDRTFSIVNDGYTEIEAGSTTVKAVERGAGTEVASDTFSFTKDEHYTIFLIEDALNQSGLLFFRDNLSEPAAGKAHIRIAHLIPDGPTVKLAVPGSGQGPIFNNVKFMDNTEFFTPIDAGTMTFRVQDVTSSGGGGGGGGGGGAAGIFNDVPVTLEAGKIYTLVLVGRLADQSAGIVVLTHEHE